MISLPSISGNLRPVPLSSYKEIIGNYVEKVGKLEQVSSIIQMGSFSKPGISDIDLIVTIKDNLPFPSWDQISLKEISKSHKDREIIAHDIFVIPETIAENAEAYFYIDQQIILKGDRLGGKISADVAKKCKEFLALEYAVFSLDSIAGLLLSSSAKLRDVVLLISTMRHSASIAFDLKIIAQEEKIALIQRIEKLRTDVLSSNYSVEELSYLFEKFINLLNCTVRELSKSLTLEIENRNTKRFWRINSKTCMLGIENEIDFPEVFKDIINRQSESVFSRYCKIVPVPMKSQMHIGAYLDGNGKAARYFKTNFKIVESFHDTNELNAKVRRLRGEVVREHWEFIKKAVYLKSSGKAYCGLSYPHRQTYKSWVRKVALYYQIKKINLS